MTKKELRDLTENGKVNITHEHYYVETMTQKDFNKMHKEFWKEIYIKSLLVISIIFACAFVICYYTVYAFGIANIINNYSEKLQIATAILLIGTPVLSFLFLALSEELKKGELI